MLGSSSFLEMYPQLVASFTQMFTNDPNVLNIRAFVQSFEWVYINIDRCIYDMHLYIIDKKYVFTNSGVHRGEVINGCVDLYVNNFTMS